MGSAAHAPAVTAHSLLLDLNLPKAVLRMLAMAGAVTVGQAAALDAEILYRMRGVGPATVLAWKSWLDGREIQNSIVLRTKNEVRSAAIHKMWSKKKRCGQA